MSKAAPKKRVPIRSKGSNELRFSSAAPGYIAAESTDPGVPVEEQQHGGGPDPQGVPPESVKEEVPSGADRLPPILAEEAAPSATQSTGGSGEVQAAKELVTSGAAQSLEPDPGSTGETKVSKSKTPPVTMEAYIAQAYARKGQRVAMNLKLEKSLSAHHRLDEDARDRLLTLAQQDNLLLVPRQILLAAMSIKDHPIPKRVLVDFVHAVMQRQPIFGSVICKQALDITAAVPSVYSLCQSILAHSPLVRAGDEGPSASDLEMLRLNALRLMLVWLFHSKGVRLEDLSAVLLQIVWKPAANELESDVQRIRALTEISEPAAIGWVAEQYLRTATSAQESEERIHREAVALRADLTNTRDQLAVTTAVASSLQEELEQHRQQAAQAVTALQQDNQQTRTHLSHDIEVMRGRVVESLRQNIERLETGLAALNREVPRVAVMVERAEIVIESLKLELKELEGEE